MNKVSFYMPLAFAGALVIVLFAVWASAPGNESRDGEKTAIVANTAGAPTASTDSSGASRGIDEPPGHASAFSNGVQPSGTVAIAAATASSAALSADSPAPRPREYNLHPKTVRYRDKVLVLMYHHIDERESMVTIAPSKFRDHMKAVLDSEYNVIPMEAYIDFMKHGKPVPPNAVVVTFDDGYESFYTQAFPVLKELGIVATNFVVVSYVDTDYPKLPFLTWKQIGEMKRAGMSFYSHSYDLHNKKPDASGSDQPAMTQRRAKPRANRLETDTEYKERVVADLLLAEQQLRDHLGNQEPMLCFPFGAYSDTVVRLANEIGIDIVFTIKEGINTRETREIMRINAGVPYLSAEGLVARMNKFK
ncbi:polysaccharide deacetylase family protein [Paenibacillus flagellatus]|uniref:Polysaccharide deacetylase n=1 Tax=Paenibacillus flagellatus TaxID=2211139 RepID=A0A2V5KEF5_9BACL|nr:polysaccharide deacetylase family protein [Paenibacillus flagellatus]PYI56483.1 polysaccharide deacetylase [Paenibacillus flagellatus]